MHTPYNDLPLWLKAFTKVLFYIKLTVYLSNFPAMCTSNFFQFWQMHLIYDSIAMVGLGTIRRMLACVAKNLRTVLSFYTTVGSVKW